jgi:hypothetical protein
MIEQPVITPVERPNRGTKATHPAYAQIRAGRVTGRTNLYGSDFSHHNFISISIKRSALHRNLHTDWYHGGEELIEVDLSEAQWATFVSAMNIGDGVPCTISHLGTTPVPRLPDPISRADQFSDEMRETVASSVSRLRNLAAEVAEMGLPKRKAEQISNTIGMAIQDLNCNAPFVAKCFDEHVEGGIESAKSEIHGYMVGAIQRSGLAALSQDGTLPLLIDSPSHN